jgi:hypothetical protein
MSSCHDREGVAFHRHSTLPIMGISGKPRHHVSSSVARTGFWKWILMALHDTRYREAKRIIRRNQHLLVPFADVPTSTEAGFQNYAGNQTAQQQPIFHNRSRYMKAHRGKCFCGAVEIEVQGAPEGMGYCHCESCRSWSAGPINAFTLWQPQNVKVIKGEEHLGRFKKTATSDRHFCQKCGGHLMTDHPPLGLVDVYAATIPTLKFSPGVHVNYSETVLPMKDGLPKLKDFPAELGGSGIALPE